MKSKPRKRDGRAAYLTEGNGNVFADLGLPSPEQEPLKARLTLQIHPILKDSGMTQVQIAKILGVQQPQVLAHAESRRQFFRWSPDGISYGPAPRRGDHRPPEPPGTSRALGCLCLNGFRSSSQSGKLPPVSVTAPYGSTRH